MKWYLLVLKKYAEFKGRSRRSEYWYFTLFSVLISLALNGLDFAFHTEYIDSLYSLAVLIPGLAVGVRRMHDVNKSGWFILVPIYNLILACTEGTEGSNEYGRDPKRPDMEDDIDLIGNN